jgi:hypothetical protein
MAKQPNSEYNLGFCHIVYVEQTGYQNVHPIFFDRIQGPKVIPKGRTKILFTIYVKNFCQKSIIGTCIER